MRQLRAMDRRFLDIMPENINSTKDIGFIGVLMAGAVHNALILEVIVRVTIDGIVRGFIRIPNAQHHGLDM